MCTVHGHESRDGRYLIWPAVALSAVKSPWQTKVIDVWGGKDQKVEARSRRVSSAFTYFTAAGFRVDKEWRTSFWNTISPREVVDSIKSYLFRTKILASFPGTDAFVDGRELRAPDYRFCTVPIHPIVVAMVPYPHYNRQAGSLSALRGDDDSAESSAWGMRLSNDFIVDDLFATTSFLLADGTVWFAPESDQMPSPMFERSDARADSNPRRGNRMEHLRRLSEIDAPALMWLSILDLNLRRRLRTMADSVLFHWRHPLTFGFSAVQRVCSLLGSSTAAGCAWRPRLLNMSFALVRLS